VSRPRGGPDDLEPPASMKVEKAGLSPQEAAGKWLRKGAGVGAVARRLMGVPWRLSREEALSAIEEAQGSMDATALGASRRVSPKEGVALVIMLADRSARGGVPTGPQVLEAERQVRGGLGRRGVKLSAPGKVARAAGLMAGELATADDAGSVWDKFKDGASTVLRAVRPALPVVATALPAGAAAAVATTLIQQRRARGRVEKERTPVLPRGAEAVIEEGRKSDEAGWSSDEEIAGRESGGLRRRRRRYRRFRPSALTASGAAVPHDVYRAAIWQKASRLAGGGRPQTSDLARAKLEVDARLGRRGARIAIPGAKPGRRTV